MVYIEEVVADNLIINCILLALTMRLLKEKCVWRRLAVSASIGALFAVFLPFVDKAAVVYKLSALIAITLFAVKHKSFKRYILFTLVFAAVSFAAGGAVYGIFNLTSGKNGIITYPAGRGLKYLVFAALAFVWIVLRQIRLFALRKRISASEGVTAEVVIKDKSFRVACFNDTGNRLVDGVTLKPVMVLSRDVGADYVCESARTIEVGTVNSTKELPLITADRLTIHTASGDRLLEKVPMVISDTVFEEYKLIYNAAAI